MKLVICAVVLAVVPASASSWVENAAVSADFVKNTVQTFSLPVLPVPKCSPLSPAAQRPSPEWIAAVKKTYLSSPIGSLPPAQESELPAAALQQLQWDAHAYPSRAYKIIVDEQPAFVIENDNPDALYVNIFDGAGAHIAYGGFDENYDFYWLTKKK